MNSVGQQKIEVFPIFCRPTKFSPDNTQFMFRVNAPLRSVSGVGALLNGLGLPRKRFQR
jgi:hypothetical protein